MNLPENLREAIDHELSQIGLSNIKKAYEKLSEKYRDKRNGENRSFLQENSSYISYIGARMPATYAATVYALKEARLRTPGIDIKSIMDLGAGPGTASWAASSIFTEIEKITLVERDSNMISLGIRLAERCNYELIKKAKWEKSNLEDIKELPSHDIVVCSFSVGELSEQGRDSAMSIAFDSASKLLVVVEPGTPRGFEQIIEIRKKLIEKGAIILAPCPHSKECPIKQGDWCHFSCRLDRTSFHRHIKSGTLGYEDEKFVYLIASKNSFNITESRVIKSPLKRSGHLHLSLCTKEGLQEKTLSKRHKEIYKAAKELEWGDEFKSI